MVGGQKEIIDMLTTSNLAGEIGMSIRSKFDGGMVHPCNKGAWSLAVMVLPLRRE